MIDYAEQVEPLKFEILFENWVWNSESIIFLLYSRRTESGFDLNLLCNAHILLP